MNFSVEFYETAVGACPVQDFNTRVLWFFMKNRRIIAVHGIRNKGRAIPERDLRTARERMRDWHERTQT